MKASTFAFWILILQLSALGLSGCGVKGPPLPPLEENPQNSDKVQKNS